MSLKVAGFATAINLVLGVAVGFLLARTRFPGRDLRDTVPMLLITHDQDDAAAFGGDVFTVQEGRVVEQVPG